MGYVIQPNPFQAWGTTTRPETGPQHVEDLSWLTGVELGVPGTDDPPWPADTYVPMLRIYHQFQAPPADEVIAPIESLTGELVPLVWAELALDTGTLVYAKVDLPDPFTYYGGYKQARILSVGAIKRALSDRSGNYEAAQFSLTMTDWDRAIRGKLGSNLSKWFLNRFVTLRMISDQGRRQRLIPRVIGIGYIRDYAPISPLQFSLTCEDYLAIFVGLGQNEKQVPKRTITALDFDGCPEDNVGKPVPILYGNLADGGSSEGPVTNVAAAEVLRGYSVTGLAGAENVGGSLVSGQGYQVKVTAVGNDGKEYDFSSPITVTPVGGGGTLVRDPSIPAPELTAQHQLEGRPIGFDNYRWGLVTALKQVAGVWYESDPSGWGDMHGDDAPGTIGTCAMIKVNGTPDRLRFYVFNVNDFGVYGFHPTLDPNPPVGVAGDPATPKIIRVVEVDLAGVVYSAKLGGYVDGDYTGLSTASPFGDQSGTGATHWISCFDETDGDDFTAASVGASIDLSWDAWVPPAGVVLSKYRVYYNDGAEWRFFEELTEAVTLSSPTQGVVTSGGSYYYAVTAVFGGDQTVPSSEVMGTFGVRRSPTGVRITWNPLQNADSYYVYRRNISGGGDVSALYNRRWPVSGLTWLIDDLADTGAEIIEGIPKAQGILPVTYVGDVALGGQSWRRFLVCGHALTEITALYQKNAGDDEYTQVSPGQFGVDFLAPGFGAWGTYFADTFLDINARRYTLIYGRGPLGDAAADGTRPLRVNLKGIEDVGDGTGVLIEDGFTQYLHAMRNWILQDYQAGAWWNTGPAWPDSFGLGATEVLDDASFAAASVVAQGRIVGGYKGAFVMGADETQDTVRAWIQRFNISLDAFAGFNRKSQFFVKLIDTSASILATAQRFTQALDIFQGSFKVVDRPADLENVVAYNFGRNYATGGWKYDTREVADSGSITLALQTKKSETLDLWLAPTSAQAGDVAARRLLRTKEIPRTVTFVTGLQALNTELGDVVLVTHLEGIGASGWVDRAIFLTRHELDPDRLTITLEGIDVDRLFAGNFVLGDEGVLAADWGSATETDKTYGYLCDEVTEEFGDGTAGKRLR